MFRSYFGKNLLPRPKRLSDTTTPLVIVLLIFIIVSSSSYSYLIIDRVSTAGSLILIARIRES